VLRSGGYYYFLMSSLPVLEWDAPPPLSSDRLLDLAAGWVGARDLEALRNITLLPGRAPCCKADARWQAWETFLRNLLVMHRTRRYGAVPDPYLRPVVDGPHSIVRRIDEIVKIEDAWERETAIDRLRWEFLEEVAGPSPFSFDALAAYRLRLLLLEKRARYDDERGASVLNRIVHARIEEAAGVRRMVDSAADES